MTFRFLLPKPGDDGLASPAGALALYEVACSALAEALTVDAAKEIADWSDAMRVYARQAKNRTLEIDAAQIRIKAERRLGELIAAQKASVGLAQGRRSDLVTATDEVRKVTLAEAGIDRNLSSRAQRLAALPAAAFDQRLDFWRREAEREGARVTTRIVQGVDKKVARAVREEVLGRRIMALPDRRYGVIYADPEWRFGVRSRETGLDRSADNHYPTSPTEVIAARAVATIAAPACVLFLWSTAPMQPDAYRVMEAWGFTYVSQFVWNKIRIGDRRGTGYWTTGEHEVLLIGTRGDVVPPAPGTQFRSVIDAPVGEHSEKPEVFAKMIEQYFPTLPKIELNARRARPGWDCWGFEAPEGGAF